MPETIATLTALPTPEQLEKIVPGYEAMLSSMLSFVLERGERDGRYRFIDTKFDVRTGKDFYPVAADDMVFRSREIIYSWIQGMGLDALAGYLDWLGETDYLSPAKRGIMSGRVNNQLIRTIAAMEECRANNDGRVYFCMTAAGTPLEIVAGGHIRPKEVLRPESNFSDLFYAHGLFRAAWKLSWGRKGGEALEYFRRVLQDIDAGRFHSDRPVFGSRGPKVVGSGMALEPLVAALAGIAEIGRSDPDPDWFSYGEKFIRRVMAVFVNQGKFAELHPYDFVAAVDGDGRPRRFGAAVIGNPGLSLRFIGEAVKCLRAMRDDNYGAGLIEECIKVLPSLLFHCFERGFNPVAGGVCTACDWRSGRMLDSRMPGWILPETMRAAAGLLTFCSEPNTRRRLAAVIATASNAFAEKFINYEAGMMPYRERDAAGEVTAAVGIIPDVDPGYYCGLSLMDLVRILRKLP
ncbi:MAG: hypothetical protein PHQ27_08875 [Victivallales bacterium]|nr:hypothetical protein [Victivallales bacterium]